MHARVVRLLSTRLQCRAHRARAAQADSCCWQARRLLQLQAQCRPVLCAYGIVRVLCMNFVRRRAIACMQGMLGETAPRGRGQFISMFVINAIFARTPAKSANTTAKRHPRTTTTGSVACKNKSLSHEE